MVYGSVALTVIGGIPGNVIGVVMGIPGILGIVTGIPGILGAGCGKPGTRTVIYILALVKKKSLISYNC